jgi:hypothetical protein
MTHPDLTFTGLAGLYTLHAKTAEGAQWINDHVPFEPWQGDIRKGVAIEGSYRAQEIADAAIADKLTVEVNGRVYQGALASR